MKNTIILTISALIEKGAGFAFISLMAYNFGKLEVGQYSYFFAMANILFLLFNVGGDIYNIKFSTSNRNINTAFNMIITKLLLFLVVIFSLSFFDNSPQMLILLLSFFLESIISIIRSYLFIKRKFKAQSFYLIFEKVIFITLLFLAIFSFKKTIFLYFAFVISKLLTICFYFFKEELKLNRKNIIFDKTIIKDYMSNSWSYVLHALLVILFVKMGILSLKFFDIPFEDIAIYSSSSNLIIACLILPDVLFKQYYPTVTKYMQNKNNQLLEKLTKKIQFSSTIFSFITVTTLALFSKEIIILIFSNTFIDAVKVLIILSSILITRFPLRIYSAILASSDYNYYRLIASISCASLSLVLNLILIPKWGLDGAIYSTIITEFFLYTLYKYFSMKIIKTNFFSIHELFMFLQIAIIISIFLTKEIPFSLKFAYITAVLSTLVIFRRKIKLLLTY